MNANQTHLHRWNYSSYWYNLFIKVTRVSLFSFFIVSAETAFSERLLFITSRTIIHSSQTQVSVCSFIVNTKMLRCCRLHLSGHLVTVLNRCCLYASIMNTNDAVQKTLEEGDQTLVWMSWIETYVLLYLCDVISRWFYNWWIFWKRTWGVKRVASGTCV